MSPNVPAAFPALRRQKAYRRCHVLWCQPKNRSDAVGFSFAQASHAPRVAESCPRAASSSANARKSTAGIEQGVGLPQIRDVDWIVVARPEATGEPLPLGAVLERGEIAVLRLAQETPRSVAVLDDGLARQAADLLGVPFTGTLGLLCDAKKVRLLEEVRPLLERLVALGSRLNRSARQATLVSAGEER